MLTLGLVILTVAVAGGFIGFLLFLWPDIPDEVWGGMMVGGAIGFILIIR